TGAPTLPGFAGTVPTCLHRRRVPHFVETHSDASRKTRRGSLSSAPARTITVLRSPGSSPPSEISASFPDKVHRLPSVARPADVAPPPNAGDTASRWLALCWPPSQTVEPLVVRRHFHRLVPPLPQSAYSTGPYSGAAVPSRPLPRTPDSAPHKAPFLP